MASRIYDHDASDFATYEAYDDLPSQAQTSHMRGHLRQCKPERTSWGAELRAKMKARRRPARTPPAWIGEWEGRDLYHVSWGPAAWARTQYDDGTYDNYRDDDGDSEDGWSVIGGVEAGELEPEDEEVPEEVQADGWKVVQRRRSRGARR